MNVVICGPGPMRTFRRRFLGPRWCFQCRKRVEFEFDLRGEIEPSYYDPMPSIHCCRRQHRNGDLFPGYEREWDES